MQKSLFDMTVPELKQKAKKAGVRITKKNGSPKKKAELIKELKRQTGTSNTRADKMRKAKPPGKRRSADGNIYYEYRKNRSDVPPGLTDNYKDVNENTKLAFLLLIDREDLLELLEDPYIDMEELQASLYDIIDNEIEYMALWRMLYEMK